jgi:hypothetical protein
MDLSVQEINFYNSLCDLGIAQKIECVFDTNDIIITKIDENNNPYFYCITCNTKYDIGTNTIEKIKKTIDNYLSR